MSRVCMYCGINIEHRWKTASTCLEDKCLKERYKYQVRKRLVELANNLLSFYLFAETPINRSPTKEEKDKAYWVMLDWCADRNIEFNEREIKEILKGQLSYAKELAGVETKKMSDISFLVGLKFEIREYNEFDDDTLKEMEYHNKRIDSIIKKITETKK